MTTIRDFMRKAYSEYGGKLEPLHFIFIYKTNVSSVYEFTAQSAIEEAFNQDPPVYVFCATKVYPKLSPPILRVVLTYDTASRVAAPLSDGEVITLHWDFSLHNSRRLSVSPGSVPSGAKLLALNSQSVFKTGLMNAIVPSMLLAADAPDLSLSNAKVLKEMRCLTADEPVFIFIRNVRSNVGRKIHARRMHFFDSAALPRLLIRRLAQERRHVFAPNPVVQLQRLEWQLATVWLDMLERDGEFAAPALERLPSIAILKDIESLGEPEFPNAVGNAYGMWNPRWPDEPAMALDDLEFHIEHGAVFTDDFEGQAAKAPDDNDDDWTGHEFIRLATAWPGSRRAGWIGACIGLGLCADAEEESRTATPRGTAFADENMARLAAKMDADFAEEAARRSRK